MVVDRRSTPGEGGVASLEAEALDAEADALEAEADALEAEALEAEADELEPEALEALPEPLEQATRNSANIAARTVTSRTLTGVFLMTFPFPLISQAKQETV